MSRPDLLTATARRVRSAHLAAIRLEGRLRRKPSSGVGGGRLRILADVPTYAHTTTAGSERSLHSVLDWLAGRGHEVRVALPGGSEATLYDGVEISGWESASDLRDAYVSADLIVTQLERRNAAIRMAARTRRPLVHFLRMGGADPRTVFGRPELVVFNAQWISDRFPWPGPSAVLPSPVFADDYRVESDRSRVTLIGLSELKGGPLLYALAERRPDHRFLGIRGAWGDQIVPAEVPPNVDILDTTSDIQEIYRRTRILLMPSSSEALPRTAREAAASGIPTVAHPAPGLVEVLGDGGLFADRNDIEAWTARLDQLDNPEHYAAAVAAARRVSERWDPEPDLEDFERTIEEIVSAARGTPVTEEHLHA